jgi:hypothetical protein
MVSACEPIISTQVIVSSPIWVVLKTEQNEKPLVLQSLTGKFRIKGETGKADKKGGRSHFPNSARQEQPA